MKYVLFDIAHNGMTHRQGQFGARPHVHRYMGVFDSLALAIEAAQETGNQTIIQEVPEAIAHAYQVNNDFNKVMSDLQSALAELRASKGKFDDKDTPETKRRK